MGLCFSAIFDQCNKQKVEQVNEEHSLQKSLVLDTSSIIDERSSTAAIPVIEDFQVLKMLGKGCSGKVVLVEMKGTKKLYAMKIVNKSQLGYKEDYAISEKMILQHTKHPFILKLYFAFQTDNRIYLGTDFINGGELFTHLRRDHLFTNERTQFYAAEIVLALKYLHENDIIYRDLKPENILLDCYGHIKLTDFGLSKIKFNQITYTTCGTPEYVAPEILFEQGYTQSVDWYSLGILIYEMLTGAPPFYSQDKNQMIEDRLSKPIEMPQFLSQEAVSLINGLTELQYTKRLGQNGSEEIMNHAFFQGIDWDNLYNRAIEPPYRPVIEGRLDLRNFDRQFTDQPCDSPVLSFPNDEQKYQEFAYCNFNEN